MERLDLLEKIYQYGETLSSEEMNQIVSYINIIIDAINSLIRNNNGVRSDHCEMRYILSPSQPEKPATGTNGLSNGWSNLYLLPEPGSGNSTWMSLCITSGENVYGEWSTPICVHSGTITGQQGPKGDSGEVGAFVSRVFKRQNTKPDRPVGGTYAYPIPDGWYDGVPDGVEIIWSSTCTFYGNGTQTLWSEPAQESDTNTLDIEFSPSALQPPAPLGNTPFSNHESEGWYDPNSPNFGSAGTMIWRAERKVANGEYDGGWTITRIFGEKGERGLRGESGGHYEFRYINYVSTEEYPAPIKPAEGTDGTSGGWSREQQALTEIEIKEGSFTWMTQCYLDENGIYGIWTDPIRITGANGIDGEDGTEQEFMYTRNDTGNIPDTPPTTQKNEAALFGDLGYWIDPSSGIKWTDDPQGVDDIFMWEFVTTRVKEGTIWSAWSTPVIWAKWGKQGRIGQMSYLAGVWNPDTEYIKTAERNPVVYWNNDYYYLVGELTFEGPNKHITEIKSRGEQPNLYPGVWAKAEHYKMVFTDILFVLQFAKLQSFIISGDWMFSQSGTLYLRDGSHGEVYDNHPTTLGGVTYEVNTAYLQFDPSYPSGATPSNIGVSTQHPNPNFVPDFAIDALSGRCFFWKGYFKGDVYANSLHLGNTDLTQLPSTINNMSAEVSRKLGKQVGTNFEVDGNGILTAHNAVIDGTIIARQGLFEGTVHATEFRAGNVNELNISVQGNSINFNYGSYTGAWFSTVDPSGNNSNSLYLYIKNPANDQVYTLDFSNLTAVSGGGSVATQQTNFYTDVDNPNYISNIFTSSTDNYYYSNSNLTSKYTGTVYQKVKTGWAIILDTYHSKFVARQNVSFFKQIVFNDGSISSMTSDYYASANVSGNLIRIYGTSSVAPSSNQIEGLGSLTFSTSGAYYATTTPSSGGTITRCEVEAGQYYASLVGKENVSMHG